MVQLSSSLNQNRPLPAIGEINPDSMWCIAIRGEGRCVVNTKNLTAGAGANNYVNLFSFTGPFRLIRLYGVLTDVTNIADFEDVGFDLWDGANQVGLTNRNPGGPVMDGFALYSSIAKVAAAGVAAVALNADQVRIDETLTTKTFVATLIGARQGVTNYVRIGYDSAGINVTLAFILIYEDLVSSVPAGLQAV